MRLGRFTRCVPHSVMIGFHTGVAVSSALGPLPDLTGSAVAGEYALARAWHLLLDPGSIGPRPGSCDSGPSTASPRDG